MSNRPFSVIVLSVLLPIALLAACSPLQNLSALPPVLDTDVPTGKRSTAFVPNLGQADPAVLFRTLGSASTLFFAHHEVVLPLPSPAQVAEIFSGRVGPGKSERDVLAEPAVLRLRFEGANPDTHVVGEEQLPGIVNYFIGNDPAKWRTNIPTYGSIVYEQLYHGIDLLYSGSEGVLKGTYIIAPGANPSYIRWRYDGASRVELNKGELLISVAEADEAAPLVERTPVAWQMIASRRRPVSVRYVIHRDGSIGFALGKYDATQSLMIDPTLDYSTYVGSGSSEGAYDMALDSSNNVYVTGPADAEEPDIFVMKLDPSQTGANQLIYTTYIGGDGVDRGHGIKVDSNGNAYIAGYSESDNFPTTANAFQPNFGGDADCVVIQLNAAGAMHYASYLGGTDWEDGIQVSVGDDSLMYLTGDTTSTDFPTTPNAYQDSSAGGCDAFVTVVDPSESGAASLIYSTYYGGSDSDEAWAIDVSDGIIYFAGNTGSEDLPLRNPLYQDYNGGGGFGDAYVAKLDPSRSGNDQLLFATYLGGSADDGSGGVAADTSGNVYWVGATESSDFPTTAVSPPYGGGDWDAFLVKVDTTNPSLVYSRLFGGSGDDGIRGVVFDGCGNVFVAGGTGSEDFPTVDPIQDTFRGGVASLVWYAWLGPGDGLVAGFDPTGIMTFGTYLGGTGAEATVGIGLDAAGNVYVAGGTESTDLDVVNPFQDANAGGFDVLVARIGGLACPAEHYFYGNVRTCDGEPLSEEIVITATVPGVEEPFATAVDAQSRYGYHPNEFGVPSDDPGTPEEKEGASEGEPIEFYVGGVKADLYDVEAEQWLDSYPWHSGETTELDLHVPVYTLTITSTGCCPISVRYTPSVGDSEVITGTVPADDSKSFPDIPRDTKVSLEATVPDCCSFDRWEVDGAFFDTNPITVTMDSDHTAVATCSSCLYTLYLPLITKNYAP